MPARPGLGLFGSRVGRRVFALLAFAGLAPALAAAWLTYSETTRGLRDAAFHNLRDDAKGLGMEIVANLQHRADLARAELMRLERDGFDAYRPDASGGFEAIWLLRPDGESRPVSGDPVPDVAIDRLAHRHLSFGRAQLLMSRSQSASAWLLLLESSSPEGWLVFRVPPDRIWAPRAYLPYEFAYCVSSSAGERLYCSEGFESGDTSPRFDDSSTSDFVEIGDGADARLAVSWPLFMDGEFAFGTVNITTSVAKAHALRALAGIQRIFPPLFAFIVLFVSLISLQLIRRNLVPLRKLTTAATRFSRGKLDARVRIRSADEFATLGSAFNRMARRIGRQIRTLRTMSDVDRLILSAATFDEIAEVFLRHVAELTRSPACGVIACDSDNSSVATLVTFGDSRFAQTRLGIDLESHSADADRHALDDVDPRIASPFREFGVRDLCFLPIVFSETKKGLVVIGSDTGKRLGAEVLSQCRDLTARLAIGIASAEREEILHRQAHFDELTGLPNRQLLKDRLSQAVSQARRAGKSGAVLFLDLDRFKEVNDVYGHTVGDTLLKQAADRITGVCRDADTIARLGGDEFVVLMPELESGSDAGDLAMRLVAVLSEPFEIMGTEHTLGASVGIALFPDDGGSVEILLRNSDAAMYRAKSAGRNRYEFFSEKLNVDSRRRLMLERDLRGAVRENQLELHYQPQFDAAGDRLRGAEALIRWRHPEHGYVSPGEFIDIAEQSDLIVDVGRWVLRRACRDMCELLDAGLDAGTVAINVSARQLSDPDFVRDVVDALTGFRLDPARLEIEITESVVAQNRETAIATLTTLREIGIQIGMDDFGTGYSSLSYLRLLPFDCLKIDQSFVAAIGEGEDAENICRAIITMAHSLDKQVIAEGIETREHLEFMRRHDCEYVQGYLLGRPVPIDEFRRVLQRLQSRPQGIRSFKAV